MLELLVRLADGTCSWMRPSRLCNGLSALPLHHTRQASACAFRCSHMLMLMLMDEGVQALRHALCIATASHKSGLSLCV